MQERTAILNHIKIAEFFMTKVSVLNIRKQDTDLEKILEMFKSEIIAIKNK